MTNFYRRQEEAKQKSLWLISCFFAAVIGTAFIMSLTGAGLLLLLDRSNTYWPTVFTLLPIFIALILGASLIRTITLFIGGGAGISKKLGGVPLSLKEKRLTIKERQLHNVVEEISISSGISMPQIDILEEEYGINAFAAGFTEDSAVLGITRGAVDLLNREQLQGVVAHEFSHIASGDMRLNLLLVGFVFGLLGPLAFVSPPPPEEMFSGSQYSEEESKNALGELGTVITLGLLCSVSVLGCICVSYIKSYISKQREFLADASAVQFTRNNSGLADALKIIGGYSKGSRVRKSNILEFNHIFVAESDADITVNSSLLSDIVNIFDTHPPLSERILQLEPGWDGTFPNISYSVKVSQEDVERAWIEEGLIAASAVVSASSEDAGDAFNSEDSPPFSVSPLQTMQSLAEDKDTAVLIPILLLFDGTKTARHFIERDVKKQQFTNLLPLLGEKIAQKERLPLLLSSLPALQQLSSIQREEYMTLFDTLAFTDRQVTPHEWRLLAILRKALKRQRVVSLQKKSGKNRATRIEQAVHTLFAEFSHECGGKYAPHLFKKVMEKVGYSSASLSMPANIKEGQYQQFEEALYLLRTALPLSKREEFVKICFRMITADKKITVAEAELYQVVAMLLEIPVSPLKASSSL